MRIVTAETMRALDRRAMEEGGIPGVVLMENAGRAVFAFLAERYGPLRGREFTVWCGTGNNGGDGFVTARCLRLAGALVRVILVGKPERITGDARIHFDVLRCMGLEPCPPTKEEGIGGIQVDALLGTGVSGAPRDPVGEAIRRINAAPGPVVAVDIPSGVDADTGATPGEAVRAAATVTFAYPKLGMFLAPGADCVGELVVDPIGFDWEALHPDSGYAWNRLEALRPFVPARPAEAHKGLFGHVLVVGGSRGMSGAPTMTAKAALRAGAGLVTVAAPGSAQPLIAGKLDEAMTLALPENDGALCEASFDALAQTAERCDVLCLGPGATSQPGAQALVRRVLREIEKPVVLDADGLNALSCFPDALEGRTAPVVLTPHPGECGRLLGTDAAAVQADRIAAVRAVATRFSAVVVLKGRRTLVCDGKKVTVNTTGNPGMATGGSGDSLTGIVGALLGQGLGAFDAACAGVWLHGRAGDLAAGVRGQAALIAGDIIEALPRAMREWEGVG